MMEQSWATASTPLPTVTKDHKIGYKPCVCVLEEKTMTPGVKVLRNTSVKLGTAQRTRALFNILTRPPLLCTPSLGISLPFASQTPQLLEPILARTNNELKELACSDPCLVSIDGLLDGMFAARNAIEYLLDECSAAQAHNEKSDDSKNATLNVLDNFLTRVDPILTMIGRLRVGLTDFRLGEIIGRGACGVVRVIRELAPPNSVYAMKSQFKGTWLYHDPEGSQLLLERTVLSQAAMIGNPWLPHLHYAFQDDSQLYLVMDYEPGGDMYIFLSKTAHLLDSEMIQFYAAEVVEGAHSLHQMGYIHCDIKPENYAIERSGHLKLIDFGSAIRLDSDGQCICPTMVGTKEYLNIELLTQRKRSHQNALRVGPQYDYWAVGVFIYEMFYGQTPFYNEDDETMMENIVNFKKTLAFPKSVQIPDAAKDLICRLICEPSQRLSYEEIVQHPFFQDVDFATIRLHTPPYLPPVGEVDDVSNFSGGAARIRDEQLLDLSNGACTDVSPSRALAMRRQSNLENVAPCQPQASVNGAAEVNEAKVKQRQAIYEAAVAPINEEIQEVEDIEWQGPVYAQDLPFVGFSFTPGLLARETHSRQMPPPLPPPLQILPVAVPVTAQQSTSVVSLDSLGDTSSGSATLAQDLSLGGVTMDDDQGKIAELTRRNRFLTKQITKLRNLHKEELEKLRQHANMSINNTDIILELKQAVADNFANKSTENAELVELESRILALTNEKQQLADELTATRKSLLDFDRLNSLLSCVDKQSVDEVKALQARLNSALEDAVSKGEELSQLRLQLERLRGANSQLAGERDAALERAAKAEEVGAAQADEAEAARLATESEIFRLTTTTRQQGKLINHLCNFLPSEHRPVALGIASSGSSVLGSGGECPTNVGSAAFVRSASRWRFGGSGGAARKSVAGHSAFFAKTRSMLRGKKAVVASKSSMALDLLSSGAHSLSSLQVGDTRGTPPPPKRPRFKRRVQWVRSLSTLRSKSRLREVSLSQRAVVAISGVTTSEGLHGMSMSDDEMYTGRFGGEEDDVEDEFPVLEEDYSSEIEGGRDRFSSLSTVSSCRSSQGNGNGAERVAVGTGLRGSRKHHRPRQVLWASDLNPIGVSQPGLLKQLSKVLGKGRANDANRSDY